ncbi:hypothetical protein KKF55_05675 [Patescibacteria group bacterium]|nr:hypothetical protein [Patescibacteria group bacterium]
MNLESRHNWHEYDAIRESRLLNKNFEPKMTFNLDPYEPEKKYDTRGNEVDNEAREQRSWTRKEFSEHMKSIFEHHYNQHKQSSEDLDEAAEGMGIVLDKIEEEIFENNEEFQRGSADYYKAYQKSWKLYMDNAKFDANNSILKSGVFTHKKAPGIYKKGKLVAIPGNLPSGVGTNFNARSEVASANVREIDGKPRDLDRGWLLKEYANTKATLTGIWNKEKYLESHPEATEEDYNRLLEKRVFEKAKFSADDIALYNLEKERYVAPPEPILELGKLEDAVDFRDRDEVAEVMRKALGLSIDDESDFNSQIHIEELEAENKPEGYAQVLTFRTKGPKREGEEVKRPIDGLTLVGRKLDNTKEAEVTVLDFRQIDDLASEVIGGDKEKFYSHRELKFLHDWSDQLQNNVLNPQISIISDDGINNIALVRGIIERGKRHKKIDNFLVSNNNNWKDNDFSTNENKMNTFVDNIKKFVEEQGNQEAMWGDIIKVLPSKFEGRVAEVKTVALINELEALRMSNPLYAQAPKEEKEDEEPDVIAIDTV